MKELSSSPVLCYRCGSHVPDTTDTCPTCGQKFDAASRQVAGASTRKRGGGEGAPYKPGDTVAGRYTVRELLGAGPVGSVFRARDTTNEVEVALKVINPRLLQEPEERTQFSLVLKVGKKLSHPYLSRVYEEGFEQDKPFFTAQLIDGMTLRRMMEMRLAKGQPFTLREVEPLLNQLGAALDAAHRYGPHSDLKPENILVLPDVLKVTDYGLALGIPRPPFVQAQKGFRAEGYIAPEYVSGGEIDARMDIYSLAVIVGEMLTGLMPDVDGIPELLTKNPDLPPAFEALYRRALNANPLVRPKSAGEFASEFSTLVTKGAGKRPSRQIPALGSSALASTARGGDRPPPPVPTDLLPLVSVAPPIAAARPAGKEHAPPVDATQPMDAAMLEAIMAATPVLAAKAPEARPAAPAAAPAAPVSSPLRAPAPAVPLPRQPVKPGAARSGKSVEKRRMPTLWLVLLAVAGLATGSAGAFVLARHFGSGARQEPPVPVQPPTPGQEQGPPPAEELAGAALAPAGRCLPGMKLVSGGNFKQGVAPDDKEKMFDDRPLESIQVASFCIDEYEYPNQPGVQPTVNVSWDQALKACGSQGKRLCSEAQWEKACKGPGNGRFPYGNDFDANRCNTEESGGKDRAPAVSGRFQDCRSSYKVADLSGNVAEWTSSSFEGDGLKKIQKGGAADRPGHAVRCAARVGAVPSELRPTLGFRCCADVLP